VQFPREYFRRYDESPDELFYSVPRLVVHIDDGAIAATTQLYGELLPESGHILDLMSSWRSHLPLSFKGKVSALGMNAEEMQQNPQVDEFVVQNLNRTPRLPYADQTFDGAVCTVSVQYLVDPITVFADVRRVLKPAAPFIITFSNRCFPSKAVAIWQMASMAQKAALVASYLEAAGFADIHAQDRSPQVRRGLFGTGSGDPLIGVWGRRPQSDL
jgi:SAM-dependent methyltransferase